MKTISNALKAYMGGESFVLAQCVKLTRRDGVILGFTTWDRDIVYSGVTYEALAAVTPSQVKTGAGVSVDNMEIVGLLSSNSITQTDVVAGLYDGCTFLLFRLNPTDITMGALIDQFGSLGEIRLQEAQYTVELLSLSKRLMQHTRKLTGALCRVKDFGDTECGLNLTGVTFSLTVSGVANAISFGVGSGGHTFVNGDFTYGKATFVTGANAGLSQEIKQHSHGVGNEDLILSEPFPFTIQVGDTVSLVFGCDRTSDRCTHYSNILRFRAEPFIPLGDKISQRGIPPSG